MGLEIGVVGLPNVGKSTLFRALTKIQAQASNYPFCTIEPNIGLVPIPDTRLNRLSELFEPEKVTHSFLKVVDIAGLVKGASQGEGLGNQFLSHIRKVDAIVYLIRCFDDPNIVHVEGRTDPIADLEIIKTELILSDIQLLQKRIEKNGKRVKGDQSLIKDIELCEKLIEHLNEGNDARSFQCHAELFEIIKQSHLITIKPSLYAANIAEKDIANPSDYEKQIEHAAKNDGVEFTRVCAKIESELADLSHQDAQDFMTDLGLTQTSLSLFIMSCHRLLNQIMFFTAGKKEVRAWNIVKGTTSPEAAGQIHTDFQKGFICADVYHFNDIHELKSEHAVQTAGRRRLEGKDYIVNDGDIIHFRFNV